MKKKRKKFNLKKEYLECWNYIKDSRRFIYSIIAIFFAFVILGFFVSPPTSLTDQIMKFIENLLFKTEGLSRFQLIKFIFFNNLKSSFFGMIFGVLLGIFPIISTLSNGYLLGFISALSSDKGGAFLLWRILPHGVFELPALFISLGLGLKFGTFIFQKKKIESFRKYLKYSLKVFLFIIVPLLLIAGIIEGFLVFITG